MSQKAKLILDAKATLGEGPIWDDQRQVLFWVDIVEGKLFAYDPARHQNEVHDIGQYVGTIVPAAQGDQVMLAVYDGFASYNLETRELHKIVNPEADKPLNRFNEGKCDPNGRFWAGTLDIVVKDTVGSLYCLDHDLSVRKVLSPTGISNGLAWRQDGKVMYYIDTRLQNVRAYDFDTQKGMVSNERVVVRVPKTMGDPDGMTIDSEGMLWVALWGGGAVGRWNPENGELLMLVELPVTNVTAPAFGGANLDTLYITTARSGLSPQQLKKEPHAGGLFALKPGVTGIPAYRFVGNL